jgi:hypothetical protein
MLYQNKSTWIKGLKEIIKSLKYQKKKTGDVETIISSAFILVPGPVVPACGLLTE